MAVQPCIEWIYIALYIIFVNTWLAKAHICFFNKRVVKDKFFQFKWRVYFEKHLDAQVHDNFRFCDDFKHHRNIQFHLFTFIKYGHLYMSLQLAFILRWNIISNLTPSNCITHIYYWAASRTKVCLNYCFPSILTTFASTLFWKAEALSSSSVTSILALSFWVAVVVTVVFKTGLSKFFWILSFVRL